MRAVCAARRAVATASFTLYFSVNEIGDYAYNRDTDDRNYRYIDCVHFLLLLLILSFFKNGSLPLLFSTINTAARAATASHTNTLHHQLPTVYTAAETTKLAASQNKRVHLNVPFLSSPFAVAQAAKQGIDRKSVV